MKTKTLIILGAMALTCTACFSERDIQVEMVRVRLVRIDTIFRYKAPELQQLLTWQDDKNIQYISYQTAEAPMPIGYSVLMMKRR